MLCPACKTTGPIKHWIRFNVTNVEVTINPVKKHETLKYPDGDCVMVPSTKVNEKHFPLIACPNCGNVKLHIEEMNG